MANINIPAMTEATSLNPATDWVECTVAGVNKKISPNNAVKDTVTVAANTTHKSSDGSDHSFIDQDVTSGSSPTIDGTNITGIPTAGIDDDAVTYAKMQNVVADDRILGNVGGAGGIVAELTGTQVRTLTGLGTGDNVEFTEIKATGQAYSETNTLSDAATVATNCALGNVHKVTLAGNRTLGAPTNLKDGATYIWVLIQDGTGSRTLGYNAVFKFPGGTNPVLTTAANSVDILTGVSDGTNVYCNIANDLK
jgi:hypothetical protein